MFFDFFCGVGGVFCGVDFVGFYVQYVVDKSLDVWEIYKINFFGCLLYMGLVDDFIKYNGMCQRKVDILYLFLFCQFFLLVYICVVVNDDDNIFVLMGCFFFIEVI